VCYTDCVSNRKGQRVNPKRLTIELREDEEEFVRQMRGRAIARGSTLRDWVVEAMREKAERDRDS
jgi:uncharacterized protein (DUF1778 family)